MKTRVLKLLVFVLFGFFTTFLRAQTVTEQMILAPMDIFVPHWQVGVSGGAGYDVGEAKFLDLISPSVQLSGAYHFSEVLAAQLSVSGFMSKNRYAFPEKKYSWKYIQPTLELKVDLASLFGYWTPERRLTPYIYGGLGVAFSFDNGDAEDAVDKDGRFHAKEFEKLWRDHRWNPVAKAGLGAEFWATDRFAITLEGNANLLPDHYNSKKGRHDNIDWRFNALVGVRFRLGEYSRKTAPVYVRHVTPAPAKPDTVVKTKYITKQQADLAINIHFDLNRSELRESEFDKLHELCTYLQEHPERHVLLTGYADRDTGTPEINDRLSKERSAAVAQYLRERGIGEARIHTDAKGDRIQPFEFPAANRVCICIVLNPEYL